MSPYVFSWHRVRIRHGNRNRRHSKTGDRETPRPFHNSPGLTLQSLPHSQDEAITDFQWWASRFPLDGPRAMREDLASTPDLDKLLSRVESTYSTKDLAQRIAADDFQIPDRLRTSAREWLAEAQNAKIPAILVAGARTESIAPVTRWTAQALGRELARRGWTLVAGTQPGVDHIVINAFVEEHRRHRTGRRGDLQSGRLPTTAPRQPPGKS